MSENAQRRSEGRARRRSATRDLKPDEEQGADGVQQAVRSAAAAAAVGAAVGAARALASRGADTEDATDRDEAEPESRRHPEEDEPREDDADRQTTTDDAPPHADQPPERSPNREEHPRQGASTATVRSIVDKARGQLRDLHGRDAESVTSLERIGDGWRVTFEVLEVERIPSSTDVLATYAVDLDDDGRLLSFERARRYARAQADRGDDR